MASFDSWAHERMNDGAQPVAQQTPSQSAPLGNPFEAQSLQAVGGGDFQTLTQANEAPLNSEADAFHPDTADLLDSLGAAKVTRVRNSG